jgi:hypothetical protein
VLGVNKCPALSSLKRGARCTCFFHLKENNHNRKKFIPCLKKNTREYVWFHEDKERVLHDHFLNILGTSEQRTSTLNWVELELP